MSSCKLRLYNLKSGIVVYMNRYFMFIHLQFYLRNFFFTRADFDFDWFFFIKLIWWNTSYFFKIWSNWFDQTKTCQILPYTLSNILDSINLIKLIWPCISGFRHTHCRGASQVWHDISSVPSIWGNRFLLADLYVLSLHGLSEHESKGNMYCQLTTEFVSLDRN